MTSRTYITPSVARTKSRTQMMMPKRRTWTDPASDDPMPIQGKYVNVSDPTARNGRRWWLVYEGRSREERIVFDVTKDVEESEFKL